MAAFVYYIGAFTLSASIASTAFALVDLIERGRKR